MSKIGYLKKVTNPDSFDGDEFHGEISTLQINLNIKLLPNKDSMSANAPNFIIYALMSSGSEIPIGGAWQKQKMQVSGGTLEFLSISIDDPSLPNPLNVAAFKQDESNYDITWRRRQSTQQPTVESA